MASTLMCNYCVSYRGMLDIYTYVTSMGATELEPMHQTYMFSLCETILWKFAAHGSKLEHKGEKKWIKKDVCVLFSHDSLAQKYAPLYPVWLQQVEQFRRYFLDKA